MFVKMLIITAACMVLHTGCDGLYGFIRVDESEEVEQEITDTMPVPFVTPIDGGIVPSPRTGVDWWMPRHERKTAEVRDAPPNPKMVFIGDSITMFWEDLRGTNYPTIESQSSNGEAWQELSDMFDGRIMNLGFGHDMTGNVLWRIEHGQFPLGFTPEYVVLLIGTNQGHVRTPQSAAAGIARIIQFINGRSPDTTIILMSLLPRGEGLLNQYTQRNFEVNSIISRYEGFHGVRYFDFAQYLLNDLGGLMSEYFTDNLHLTNEGYALWKEKLLEFIDEL